MRIIFFTLGAFFFGLFSLSSFWDCVFFLVLEVGLLACLLDYACLHVGKVEKCMKRREASVWGFCLALIFWKANGMEWDTIEYNVI
jgi:hypothetical protein